MPPRLHSRFMFETATEDEDGDLLLSEPEPFRYLALRDNRAHVVGVGDTLWNLAARYFRGIPDPAQLWWVIADFQPEPLLDPTITLVEGSTLIIPSVATVVSRLFSEDRRKVEPV